MSEQLTTELVVVSQTARTPGRVGEKVALFAADGSVLIAPKQAAAQVDSVAADVATLKTDFNALLAKLRTAGIMAP